MASGSLPTFSYRGVTYKFVDTPLQSLQDLTCSICLQLVSDPVQTSCGHLFCEICIKGTNTCPIDHEDFTTTPDNYNKQRLRSFKVKCPNSGWGCKWQGELGDAERHKGPCLVKLKTNCLKFPSKPQRPDAPAYPRPLPRCRCPHCQLPGTYKSIYITKSHFVFCGDFSLSCPAGCQSHILRKNMATHLQQTCPMELVECEYKMLGCREVVRRKEIDQHLADDKYHLKMAMKAQATMFSCLQEAFSTSFKTRPDVSLLPLPFRPWLQNTPTCYPRPPWVIKLEGFQVKREKKEVWFSDPVHSHFGGYKCCLRVDANGCQDDKKHTYVSAFICIARGENDNNLKWPFKGTIKVSLLNQLEDGQHHAKYQWTPHDDVPVSIGGRVTEGERAGGWGHSHFIRHRDLGYQADTNKQFLKDDALFFRVDSIEPEWINWP